jgi:hypothetical protein
MFVAISASCASESSGAPSGSVRRQVGGEALDEIVLRHALLRREVGERGAGALRVAQLVGAHAEHLRGVRHRGRRVARARVCG